MAGVNLAMAFLYPYLCFLEADGGDTRSGFEGAGIFFHGMRNNPHRAGCIISFLLVVLSFFLCYNDYKNFTTIG